MINFSVVNEPTYSFYMGCRADRWRPQGEYQFNLESTNEPEVDGHILNVITTLAILSIDI